MSDFYNTDWDLQEAQARRRREAARRAYEFDVSNLVRKSQESTAELNRQYAQGLEPRATGYTRRGLGRSGLFRRAMSQYAAQQQRGLGDITRGVTESLAQKQLAEQQSAQELQDTLDALARAKAQQIYNEAAQLKSWAPFTGLYS
jgi:hypothetical protein